jgi:hypothetical protein
VSQFFGEFYNLPHFIFETSPQVSQSPDATRVSPGPSNHLLDEIPRTPPSSGQAARPRVPSPPNHAAPLASRFSRDFREVFDFVIEIREELRRIKMDRKKKKNIAAKGEGIIVEVFVNCDL